MRPRGAGPAVKRTSVWARHRAAAPRAPAARRRRRCRRRGHRRRHRRHHHRRAAARTRARAPSCLEAQPACVRGQRVHHRQGLIPARDGLRGTCARASAGTVRPAYGAANEAALAWMAERVASGGDRVRLAPQALLRLRRPTIAARPRRRHEAAAEAGLPATLVEEGTPGSPTRWPRPCASRTRPSSTSAPYLLALGARGSPSGLRALARGRRRRRRTLRGQDARRPRHRRSRRGRHALPLPRPCARVPARAPAAVLRAAVQHRGRAAARMYISGDSPTARSARCRRRRGDAAGRRRGPPPRRGRRHRGALRRARGVCTRAWAVRSVDYRWSSQDNTTVDTVPYVGRMTPLTDKLLMATGFAKWGMTGGTAAALVLADSLLGRENPWASLFDPNRIKPRAAASRFVEENARVGLHFVGDRLKHRGTRRSMSSHPARGHRPPRRREGRRRTAATTATLVAVSRCAPTSAARSTGTPRSAAGTAPAMARASPPRATSSRGPPCTGWSTSPLPDLIAFALRVGVGSADADRRRYSPAPRRRRTPGPGAGRAACQRSARRGAGTQPAGRCQRDHARHHARRGRAGDRARSCAGRSGTRSSRPPGAALSRGWPRRATSTRLSTSSSAHAPS